MDIAPIDSAINNILENYIRKPDIIRGIVHFLIILYAARIAPTLPRVVLDLFDNQYFKLFVFSLILWTAQMAPSTSILIALAFMVTVNYANRKPLWEFMENVAEQVPTMEVPTMEVPTMEIPTGPEIPPPMGPEIPPPMAPEAPTMTPQEAVVALAQAAASPEAVPPVLVAPVAQVAQEAVSTEEGAKAVSDLAQQAIVPEAGVPEKVEEAVQTAMISMPPPQIQLQVQPAPAEVASPVAQKEQIATPAPLPAGCFPMREYDMSKVTGMPHDNFGTVSF